MAGAGFMPAPAIFVPAVCDCLAFAAPPH